MRTIYIFIAFTVAFIFILPMIINGVHTILQSVHAQPSIVNNTITTITPKDIVNMTKPGEKVVLRGIVSSDNYTLSTIKSGEILKGVTILPNRPDGTIYAGTVTFTASKPVEVGTTHWLYIDNSTLSSIDEKTFGHLYSAFHHDKGENGTAGEVSVGSVIVPDYGVAPPYFSASIPFVGDSLWLRTTNGEPFIAAYEVSADIVQPIGVMDLDSAINTTHNQR